MRFFSGSIIAFFTLFLYACGGGSSSSIDSPQPPATAPPPPAAPPTFSYQQPDDAICDVSLVITEGLLCAIQPSRLDANSRDQFGADTTPDFILGFGYHAVAFPQTGTEIKGVYIHLTGSYGRPYNQFSGNFGSALFLQEALSAGYITLQIAYNNRFSVNLDTCAGDVSRLNVDNCAGDVRREKITGNNFSTVNDTPIADSIEFRIVKLVEYLQAQGFNFPFEVVTNANVNWDLLRVGGHSQGAGHALYLSKYFSALHACLLAGGYDAPDTVPSVPAENIADWLLDDSVVVDINRVRALTSVDDEAYNAWILAYDLLGLVKDVHYKEFSGAPYANAAGDPIDGHGAAVQDPRYRSLRIEACFSD